MQIQQLSSIALEILSHTPYRPFFCLPLSALFYATLKDNHGIECKLATGNLAYQGNYIFKQDFSILEVKAKNNTVVDWAGHAWVEIEDLIFDLSIFRTIYSKEFLTPHRMKLIEKFGEGRGLLIGSQAQLISMGLTYETQQYLPDNSASKIIRSYLSSKL